MYISKRLITVQGHPEFNEEIMREVLNVRHKAGVFDLEMYNEGIRNVDKYHDGVVVAATFLKFLL